MVDVCSGLFSIFHQKYYVRQLIYLSIRPLLRLRPRFYRSFIMLCPFVLFLFLPCFCFFGNDVAFSEYFCTTTVKSLYGEHVERFPLPDVVMFLLYLLMVTLFSARNIVFSNLSIYPFDLFVFVLDSIGHSSCVLLFCFCFFLLFYFFGDDVAFSGYFCTTTI